MDDLPTRLSIWLALALFVAAQVARRGADTRMGVTGPWWFGVGWAAFLCHGLLAFEGHYGWSHATALAETAAQTEALTGVRTGSGLYLNYLFGLVWLAELCWWSVGETSYRGRPARIEMMVRAFFLFMIINGAVVFVDGPQRWVGLALVVVLCYTWRPSTWMRHRGRS